MSKAAVEANKKKSLGYILRVCQEVLAYVRGRLTGRRSWRFAAVGKGGWGVLVARELASQSVGGRMKGFGQEQQIVPPPTT